MCEEDKEAPFCIIFPFFIGKRKCRFTANGVKRIVYEELSFLISSITCHNYMKISTYIHTYKTECVLFIKHVLSIEFHFLISRDTYLRLSGDPHFKYFLEMTKTPFEPQESKRLNRMRMSKYNIGRLLSKASSYVGMYTVHMYHQLTY
jgi:hypothetical protein